VSFGRWDELGGSVARTPNCGAHRVPSYCRTSSAPFRPGVG